MTDRKPSIVPGDRPRFATFVADSIRKADGRVVTYYQWPESPDRARPAADPSDPSDPSDPPPAPDTLDARPGGV